MDFAFRGDYPHLVLQTSHMKHLLGKYGKYVLLDSTFGTTELEMPLYQLVVKTNCGYQCAALFFTKTRRAAEVKDAIECLVHWNPDWYPETWQVDCEQAQMNAIKALFPSKK